MKFDYFLIFTFNLFKYVEIRLKSLERSNNKKIKLKSIK